MVSMVGGIDWYGPRIPDDEMFIHNTEMFI